MQPIKCELCGSNDIVKQGEFFVCQHCGTKYSLEEAKKLYGAVEVTVSSPVKVVNNEFESKFAIAQNWEQIYFAKGPNSVKYGQLKGYDAVVKYFSDAELVGANESRYYIEFANFYCRANLEGFKSGYRRLLNRNNFINHYCQIMDMAINHATNDTEKEELAKKKQEGITNLQRELSTVKERTMGCYIATCVYGSYDCPEVWVLRRFRDQSLSRTYLGRVFIKGYYEFSPMLVKSFGDKKWFRAMNKKWLDRMIKELKNHGFSSEPYSDN